MSSESNTQQQGVISIQLIQRQSRKTAIMGDGGQKVKSAHWGKKKVGGGVYEVYNLVCCWRTKSTRKADSLILGRGNHPFQLRQSHDSTTNKDHVLARLHALKHTKESTRVQQLSRCVTVRCIFQPPPANVPEKTRLWKNVDGCQEGSQCTFSRKTIGFRNTNEEGRGVGGPRFSPEHSVLWVKHQADENWLINLNILKTTIHFLFLGTVIYRFCNSSNKSHGYKAAWLNITMIEMYLKGES